jgi:signal transduction histidine kinase
MSNVCNALREGTVMSASEFENSIYGAMFHWLPLPIILLDERFFIVLANPAAAELLHLRKTRHLSFASAVRKRNAEDLIRDIRANQVKVVQIDVPGSTRRLPQTLKIMARRLRFGLDLPNSSAGLQSRSRVQEFRLLMIQEVTSEVMLQEQLVEVERFVGMGQLAAGIAHELTNPLASIASNLLYLRNSLPAGQNGSIREAVETTAERVDDMWELLTTLSSFTRQRHPRYEVADFHELIRRTVTFIAREAEYRHIQILVSFAPVGLSFQMDVRMMKQVLLNLLKNAMEAMPGGGRLEIRTRQSEASDGEPALAQIELEDSGVGISETEMRKVFRPLYSTKPRGTGLGLPFCRQVIEEHGGEIRINSRKGSGTTVTFTIPIHEQVSIAEQELNDRKVAV